MSREMPFDPEDLERYKNWIDRFGPSLSVIALAEGLAADFPLSHFPVFWSARDIGSDHCPCVLCPESERTLRSNVSGFVRSKSEGERLLGYLDGKAFLDYRELEPNWIQLKIGACKEHEPVLERFLHSSYLLGGWISRSALKWILHPEE